MPVHVAVVIEHVLTTTIVNTPTLVSCMTFQHTCTEGLIDIHAYACIESGCALAVLQLFLPVMNFHSSQFFYHF